MKSLQENLNRAAAELPKGWIIEINVERGAGWVSLYNSEGVSVVIREDGTISEQVSDAIDFALKHCGS